MNAIPHDESGALLAPRTLKVLRIVAAAGALVFVLGLIVAPARVWPNFLLATVMLAGLGLAGTLFVALLHVTGGRWGLPLLALPASMTHALLPAAGGVLLLVFGATTLYAWADPALVAHDQILTAREAWMNVPFFLARGLVCVGAWIVLSWLLVGASRPAEDCRPGTSPRAVRLSVAFLLVFGLTFSVASFDWLMSLDRHWFSTVYAIYNATGVFLSGLAVLTLLALAVRRRPAWSGTVTEDVLHDLGKLLFAFSMFWGYIWFSQFMLIWYANNPEETGWYVLRHGGAWEPLAVANVLLNWLIPFLVLLSRRAKRNARILARVCVVLLLGRWVDLYLMVLPPSATDGPVLGLWEVALPLGAAALFLLLLDPGRRGLDPRGA